MPTSLVLASATDLVTAGASAIHEPDWRMRGNLPSVPRAADADHEWHGRRTRAELFCRQRIGLLGPQNSDIVGAETIWAFFNRFP
ncbi:MULTISPECIES: hypothetical protein [unclassified Bradyrhizobium]